MSKKCKYELLEWLSSGKCVCCLFFLILLVACLSCCHGCGFIKCCSEILSWEMVTAIATLIAAYLAYKAYNNSVRMRKQASFDSVFSQLLVNFRSYQLDKRLLTTRTEKDGKTTIVGYSTFLYFCRIYKEETSKKQPEDMQANCNHIKEIWSAYSKSLVYRASFLNIFKYIYYIVDLVDNSPLDNWTKKRYVKIVQSQLNMDILFCYLINLISAHKGDTNKHIKRLRKYEFFKNIFEDNECYKSVIEKTIPLEIRKRFNK